MRDQQSHQGSTQIAARPRRTLPRHPRAHALASLLLAAASATCFAWAVARHGHPAGVSSPAPRSAGQAKAPENQVENQVHLQVEHSLFHPIDNVTLAVERLNGRMVGKPGELISLDDRKSYVVQIDQGVTRLSAHDMTTLINSYLLQHAESAVRHAEVSFDGQQMVITGQVHKLIDLPFRGRGTITATPQGELRLHIEHFKVAGVLSKGFLELFGIRMETVAQPKHRPSFRVEGDDLITTLTELFPPPLVYGRITRVKVEGQTLVEVIGIAAEHHAVRTIPKLLAEPPNYIYFAGGRMKFGKVMMENVDLKLVSRTPRENFDFSLARYQEQIQGGYVKVMPNLGLVVYAEDFSDLTAKAH